MAMFDVHPPSQTSPGCVFHVRVIDWQPRLTKNFKMPNQNRQDMFEILFGLCYLVVLWIFETSSPLLCILPTSCCSIFLNPRCAMREIWVSHQAGGHFWRSMAMKNLNKNGQVCAKYIPGVAL
jgi:hypothetical protein